MSEQKGPSRFSRVAVIALGVAALSLALPVSAHADGKKHGKRHGNHSANYYTSDYGYHGPPPVYYAPSMRWRGPKKVRVYNYYPVPVPVAVPVPVYAYPVYPRYPSSDPRGVVRIGVDWVIGF